MKISIWLMIRRSKNLWFRQMRYRLWEPTFQMTFLKKSFLANYNLLPLNRLSFAIQTRYRRTDHRFYLSQSKLQCPLSFSYSVPNKRIQHSRFYLNKGLDRLMHGGYQKNYGLLFTTTSWKDWGQHALRVGNSFSKWKMTFF